MAAFRLRYDPPCHVGPILLGCIVLDVALGLIAWAVLA